MRNRGLLLVLVCFLIALGALLCSGHESLAKQPAKAPKPDGNATSHRPASQQPAGQQPAGAPKADHSTPAARQEPARQRPEHQRPARQKPVAATHGHSPPQPEHSRPEQSNRGPSSRPVPRHSNGPSAPDGGARGHGQPAKQPDVRTGPHEKFTHRPLKDNARHHPRPERADRGHVNRGNPSRPSPQRPTPQAKPHTKPETKPHQPRGGESTGPQKGKGSAGQHGRPASPPGREQGHHKGQGVTERQGPPPAQAGPKADVSPDKAAPPEENGTKHGGDHAGAPVGGPSNREAAGSPDRQPPAPAVSRHPDSPNVGPQAEPSFRPAGHEGVLSGPRSVEARSEGPTGPAVHSSAQRHPSSGRHVARGRAVIPAAPAGGEQSPVGEMAQGAPVMSFGSTKLMFEPPRDRRVPLFEQTEQVLGQSPVGSQGNPGGTLHKGSLTQRGPPLKVPQPLSPSGLMMGGGAATSAGVSGDGAAPLLAVIVACLIALLCRGRFRVSFAFPRPGTVSLLALERPG
jgi:hypothetical protein